MCDHSSWTFLRVAFLRQVIERFEVVIGTLFFRSRLVRNAPKDDGSMVLVALHESFDDFPVGEARHLFRMLVDVLSYFNIYLLIIDK